MKVIFIPAVLAGKQGGWGLGGEKGKILNINGQNYFYVLCSDFLSCPQRLKD